MKQEMKSAQSPPTTMDKDTLERLEESTQKYGEYACGNRVHVDWREQPPDHCPNCGASMEDIHYE